MAANYKIGEEVMSVDGSRMNELFQYARWVRPSLSSIGMYLAFQGAAELSRLECGRLSRFVGTFAPTLLAQAEWIMPDYACSSGEGMFRDPSWKRRNSRLPSRLVVFGTKKRAI